MKWMSESKSQEAQMAEQSSGPVVGLQWKTKKARPWLFDFDGIREHARRRGVQRPIALGVVESGGYTQTTFGTHRIKLGADGPIHAITCKRDCSPEQAERTLRHEIEHAFQAERVGMSEFNRAYRAAGGGLGSSGYDFNPFEVEARAAETMNSDLALTRAPQR
jgi:hypothetical protein